MVLKQDERSTEGKAQMKKFSVTFLLKIDDENNILSSHEEGHEEDVHDLIHDIMFDVDDVTIENLVVKERQ